MQSLLAKYYQTWQYAFCILSSYISIYLSDVRNQHSIMLDVVCFWPIRPYFDWVLMTFKIFFENSCLPPNSRRFISFCPHSTYTQSDTHFDVPFSSTNFCLELYSIHISSGACHTILLLHIIDEYIKVFIYPIFI